MGEMNKLSFFKWLLYLLCGIFVWCLHHVNVLVGLARQTYRLQQNLTEQYIETVSLRGVEENRLVIEINNTAIIDRLCKKPEVLSLRENGSRYSADDFEWPETSAKPPNDRFIFHNKLPKAGSTTLNAILRQLSMRNNFHFRKVESFEIPNDRPLFEKPLIEKLRTELERKEHQNEKYFLLKHHYWINFEAHNMTQPTYMNVIREPTSWFTSRYYFKRFGWSNNNNQRSDMSETDRTRSIDECILNEFDECTAMAYQPYLAYFCGCDDICKNLHSLNPSRREQALELTRRNILQNFYVIGVLEQFDDTLKLFEKMMPDFFKGASDIWKSQRMQDKRESTRTRNRTEMSQEAKNVITAGLLRHEMDIYLMIKALFNHRVKSLLPNDSEVLKR